MPGVKKNVGSRIAMIFAVVLIVVIYCLRIFNLDQDLPPFGVGSYQPKDEAAYVILAINEMEHGTMNPENPEVTGLEFPMYIQEHVRVNLLGNLMQIISFDLFGDNYYGLRMPMVWIGLVNLLLLGIVLLNIRKQYGNKTDAELWGIIGMLLLMSMHFYYYLSSRTVEPSPLRMVFAQLMMLIWLTSRKKGFWCFFGMGACITVSVFLVYITNVFLYLAVGLLLLMMWKTDGFKTFIKNCCGFALGIVALFVVAECYYRFVWGTSAIRNFFGAIGAFSSVSGYEISGASGTIFTTLRGFIKKAFRYFSANFFLYAPAILAVVLTLLPLSLWKVFKDKDLTGFLLFAVPFSFLLQTMFAEDYIWRKFIVAAPYTLYIIYWMAMNRSRLAKLLDQHRAWYNRIRSGFPWLCAKLLAPLYILFVLGIVLLIVVYRLHLADDGYTADFTWVDKIVILGLGCLPMVIWSMKAIATVWSKKKHFLRHSAWLLGCTTLLLSLSMLYIYCWSQPTYEERDMMISLSKEYELDNKYIIGDAVMGITLYNDIKPVMDYHTNYGLRSVENDMYMFHYEDDSEGMRTYLNTVLYGLVPDYYPEKIITLPGTMQVDGVTRNFAIYKATPYEEAEEHEQQKNSTDGK